MSRTKTIFVGALLMLLSVASWISAQGINAKLSERASSSQAGPNIRSDDTPRQVLSAAEWSRVDNSVDRALTFLAAQQQRAVLAHQRSDGSWDAERYQRDRRFGNSYTTALVVLAVGSPNQLLPIFQR